MMKTKSKLWIGVGAFVMAGTGAFAHPAAAADASLVGGAGTFAEPKTDTALARVAYVVAQHQQGGEAGEKGGKVALPPDLGFALKIAQIRGHLLVGDELVKAGQWKAAFPHFLHPVEELYGGIRPHLRDYRTPPFEAALKLLANAVKSRKSDDYAKAFQTVSDALAAADAGLKARQAKWPGFTVETAVELLKSAAGEYEEAIVKGRIAKPVEYQDARGFIWEAVRMIESVAAALQSKDAQALKNVRAGLAELKKAFPAPLPPKAPVKDYSAVLGDVSRIELAAGALM